MLGPTRKIPLNIGAPLLQNAALEEDDDLQDVWAKLLVNSADASSGIELRRAFVSVLAEMTTLDVRNLAAIELASPISPDGFPSAVWACKLPEKAIPAYWRGADVVNSDPSVEVLTSLSNLEGSDAYIPVATIFARMELFPCAQWLLPHSVEPSSRLARGRPSLLKEAAGTARSPMPLQCPSRPLA
jgi:hypothetical protein